MLVMRCLFCVLIKMWSFVTMRRENTICKAKLLAISIDKTAYYYVFLYFERNANVIITLGELHKRKNKKGNLETATKRKCFIISRSTIFTGKKTQLLQ